MPDVTSLRYRYNQFFILFVLCSLLYVMAQNIDSGVTDFQVNFQNKDLFIEQANLLRIKMGDHVFPVALAGHDGWLEYVGEENIDDFQNVNTFRNKKKFAQELTVLNEYLKSQGIALLIVVAPNKASIYPDKLPVELIPQSPQSRLDSLISYLENNNLPVLLDLRPALRMARQEQDVYYKTDTHWNGYGAFVAYTTIINALAQSHPELKPYAESDLKLITTAPAVHDLPHLLQITSMLEPSFFYTPTDIYIQKTQPEDQPGYDQFSWMDGSTLPTLLMFHDSFGAAYLDNYLSMNFSDAHFVQIKSMPKYLTQESIRRFKPDVIIIEIVERNLHLLPEDFPDFMRE